MSITIIKEGDKNKQGNMVCPRCGKIVLIKNHYGDPPECNDCNAPYIPIHRPMKWE